MRIFHSNESRKYWKRQRGVHIVLIRCDIFSIQSLCNYSLQGNCGTQLPIELNYIIYPQTIIYYTIQKANAVAL